MAAAVARQRREYFSGVRSGPVQGCGPGTCGSQGTPLTVNLWECRARSARAVQRPALWHRLGP